MKNYKLTLTRIGCLLLFATFATKAQQVADPKFDAGITRPAYTKNNPKVLFDEAHNNFHTTTGRYKPFADLITNDGFKITVNKEKFQARRLKDFDILIIANALGAGRANDVAADKPAFSDEECDAVRDWVRAGGSLLLVADHAPFGAAAENLAGRFGVEMSKGYTSDTVNFDQPSKNQSLLVFTRENRLLTDHAITRGRNADERINRVLTFTGQSLTGPNGSTSFLQLSETASDVAAPTQNDIRAAIERPKAGGGSTERSPNGTPLPPGARAIRVEPGKKVSAAGRSQGIAIKFGKGRVIILGEAAMLTAQMSGADKSPFGMNRTDADNRQLVLNIMRWLSGLLK
jgi:hypothetical protein